MKRFIIIIAVCFAAGSTFNCNSAHDNTKSIEKNKLMSTNADNKYIQYKSTILDIENKLGRPGTWDALFSDTNFLFLYDHSDNFTDSAIKFISDEEPTNHQKIICVFSSQKATIPNYVKFLTYCQILFKKNKISEDVVKAAVSPSFGKKRIVIKNYDETSVKKILQELLADNTISAGFRRLLENIVSGKTWQNLKTFNEQNGVDINDM
jgi:hypothetical protein